MAKGSLGNSPNSEKDSLPIEMMAAEVVALNQDARNSPEEDQMSLDKENSDASYSSMGSEHTMKSSLSYNSNTSRNQQNNRQFNNGKSHSGETIYRNMTLSSREGMVYTNRKSPAFSGKSTLPR